MNTMNHKGYTARIEFDERDNIFVGRVLRLRTMISFHGQTVAELRSAASFALLTQGQVDAFATDDVLLYGLLAQHKLQAEYTVTGEFLSYDPYGIMYRKGDAQFGRLIDDSFRRLAEDREIERRYERWFLKRLPSGVSLDLPMSPQLESMIQTLGAPTE